MHILFIILVTIQLLAKLTKIIIVIALITSLTKKTIFSCLNSRSYFPINFFGCTLLIKAFFACSDWKLICFILPAFSYLFTTLMSLIFSLLIFRSQFLFLFLYILIVFLFTTKTFLILFIWIFFFWVKDVFLWSIL